MKCHKYWPDDDESENYGPIEISCKLTNDDTELDITHRTLTVTYKGEERIIEHYQYHGWPDHGVPNNTKGLRTLLKDVQKIRDSHKTPVVVHCSAGIGR
jgi:protein tyrosine phosphatase